MQKAAHLGEESDFLVALAQFGETGRELGVEILLGHHGSPAQHRAADDHEADPAEQAHVEKSGHRERDRRDIGVELRLRAARCQHDFFAGLNLAHDLPYAVHRGLALIFLHEFRRRLHTAFAARKNAVVKLIEPLRYERLE